MLVMSNYLFLLLRLCNLDPVSELQQLIKRARRRNSCSRKCKQPPGLEQIERMSAKAHSAGD